MDALDGWVDQIVRLSALHWDFSAPEAREDLRQALAIMRQEAAEHERLACAKFVEDYADFSEEDRMVGLRRLAEAIRARGKE